jgi:hypothetical protein
MKQLDKDVDRIGRAGQAAWKRLQKCKSWSDWMAVGEALLAGRTLAMQKAETNRPEGKGYNQVFSQWLAHYGLSEIDKSARAKLLYVMEHRADIEDFRAGLPLNVRMELSHPTSVLRRWQVLNRVTKPKRLRPNYAGASKQITELEAAREVAKPTTLAGARELYQSHLRALPFPQWKAELDALAEEYMTAIMRPRGGRRTGDRAVGGVQRGDAQKFGQVFSVLVKEGHKIWKGLG